MNRIYACIDLKSFYASVECQERGLNPITTNLVVADITRTEKTICLAVSPSLKTYGIPGRARLFEVVQRVGEINKERKNKLLSHRFKDKSYDNEEIKKYPNLELDYIVAPPRMSLYLEYSTKIYNVYLKYLSSNDIHVYSIDEIFCDITDYLNYYKLTPSELITKIVKDVYNTTGITATAGIGTNLYLAKIAMDIVAKHVEPNNDGVRIATLDVIKYRKMLWNHRPLNDFWRVGRGYSKKLEEKKMYTMGDIARMSIENEDLLYKMFGVNAELLIDHAWGLEPCTISDIKNYKPQSNCLTSGQVLHCPYNFSKARLVLKEMVESLSLDLVEKELITDKIVITIGYDIENINNGYDGEVIIDHYGRTIPKYAHGTVTLKKRTHSTKIMIRETLKLYDKIVDSSLSVKRINISVHNLISEEYKDKEILYEQFDLFSDEEKINKEIIEEMNDEKIENKLQKTMLQIKKKYGKNSILKAMNLSDGATQIERNNQIGGHKA